MRVRLAGGRLYDPLNGIDGEIRDVWIEDGRIVPPPADGRADETFDITGSVVMAGGIDMHSHIAGGKVNIARLLMGEEHRSHVHRRDRGFACGSGVATPDTFTTGYAYARMGYTMAFEPAMLPANARQVHHEAGDIPIIDRGAYVLLGSEDFLLTHLARGADRELMRDYVAWMLQATRAIAIKIVNAGGIFAFKQGVRENPLDGELPRHPTTPRRILTALAEAVDALGVPHPVHVHGLHLGLPGSRETTLATIRAMEGRRIHLTHLQFHAYGREGKRGFSSGALEIAELVNASPNVSIDVGQVMFGQTITASGDTMSQYRNTPFAHPRRWVLMDIECEAGCGVLPFRYREKAFVNALQWAIGLELFLAVRDPWRIALTTDHPNGAPFTSYPHLIRLLMDRDFRMAMFERLHPAARELSNLPSMRREYSFYEIAILTRAGPAKLLGIEKEYGHLGPGAVADVCVYGPDSDLERMFASPTLLFRRGELVLRNGELLPEAATLRGATHVVEPGFDRAIERRLARHFEEERDLRLENFVVSRGEIEEEGGIHIHPCRRS